MLHVDAKCRSSDVEGLAFVEVGKRLGVEDRLDNLLIEFVHLAVLPSGD
jgi:hypothetical protein